MTDAELIARLRDACRGGDGCKCSLSEAADRIEALVKEQEKDHAEINIKADFIDATINQLAAATARAERLEAALRKIDVGEGWAAQIAREALKGNDHV